LIDTIEQSLRLSARSQISPVYRIRYIATDRIGSAHQLQPIEDLTMTIETMDKVLYTAKVHTAGARDGTSRSSDGRLEIKFSAPGSTGPGTNPEQLFAAGWSACFEGAIGIAARKMKVALPTELAIDAEVDLGTAGVGYLLRARFNVSLPGLDRDIAQTLVDVAHQTCPYSKATRGNVDVSFTLV
jgi:Ohr subfamily peroxiredoxin